NSPLFFTSPKPISKILSRLVVILNAALSLRRCRTWRSTLFSLVSEAFSIDSENLFFKKLTTDHCSEFPNLIDRIRLKHKRKQLLVKMMEINKSMAMNKYT